MAKHTPGPWNVKKPNDVNINFWIEVRGGGYKSLICETTNCLGHGGTSEANARLIAAAPDLLAALKMISCAYLGAVVWRDGAFLEVARAAIAKAEGDQ